MSDKPRIDEEKRLAAFAALEYIKDGYTVGLGTGSTTEFFIRELANRVKKGLNIKGVATSERTAELASSLGITVVEEPSQGIDIDVDGADEIDRNGNMIKGGGGALLREKIVAHNSRRVIIVVDHSKVKDRLGGFPLPVEVNSFLALRTMRQLKEICPESHLRNEGDYFTDSGNLIIDCHFRSIEDPHGLLKHLKMIPGVMEVGLFLNLCTMAIIGKENGTEIMNFNK